MNLENFFDKVMSALPGLLGAVLLLVIALFIAFILKKLSSKGLERIDFDGKLQRWGMSKNIEESNTFIETIGSIIYFATILLFTPFILKGMNMSGVVDPILVMMTRFFNFIPNLLASGLILFTGSYLCKFIKSLMQNLFEGINVDRWYRKLIGRVQEDGEVLETRLAEVLSSIIYVLIFIPILTAALKLLGIRSISDPIVLVLNNIVNAIPNILAAVALVVIGNFIAQLVGDLVESMLRTSGIDKYSQYLNFKGETTILISNVSAQILKAVLFMFFLIEGLSVLELDVINSIGNSIIDYLPSIISSLIILATGIIGGNILATFLAKVSGSKLFGEMIRYGIIIFAVFMTLEQLQFAKSIVNNSFTIILGAFAFAFALAFGLGGKEFAAKQLERADQAFKQESEEQQLLIAKKDMIDKQNID
ncbi:mechanosensitive ion channel [Tuanshanicoccus lijuaniae]|uniref:mechanosensitive ion channel n=1 Tax=Aerococcaceae bacterium zg-1292 TaxID=2774330 RepID=UPI0019377FE3|nr:mechanosensitive ion channel [Aerococcaceae bacterium zg-1292]MBS4456176.1 mechanosensitive ion channel [Aerococcaceae bacterium zg-A91]MBS4458027.1 mechanosensitive ion channel [Aerococcaceae bacterium zg-BR33]QQA37268.1 mechanosensitive ion channel [Aerococcaceae bacterium zg-1292]